MIRAITFLTLIIIFGASNSALFQKEIVVIKTQEVQRIEIGKSSEIVIKSVVKNGYHIQANPVADEFLIPTRVTIKSADGFRIGEPVYPVGKPFSFQGMGDKFSVYGGEFMVKLPITLASSVAPKEYLLEGELHYQACDSATCLAPRTIPFELKIQAAAAK